MPYSFIFVSFVTYESPARDCSEKVKVLYVVQVSNPSLPSPEETEIYVLGVPRFSDEFVGFGFCFVFSPPATGKSIVALEK